MISFSYDIYDIYKKDILFQNKKGLIYKQTTSSINAYTSHSDSFWGITT